MAALKRIVAVVGAALVVGGALAAITWAWNRSVSNHYEQRAERARLIRAVCYGEPIDEALARVPPQILIDDLDRLGASSDSPAEFVGQERIAEDVSDYRWRMSEGAMTSQDRPIWRRRRAIQKPQPLAS